MSKELSFMNAASVSESTTNPVWTVWNMAWKVYQCGFTDAVVNWLLCSKALV